MEWKSIQAVFLIEENQIYFKPCIYSIIFVL